MKRLTSPVLIVGDSTTCQDIEYATGFKAPGILVYLKTGAADYLLVPDFELARAQKESKLHRAERGERELQVVSPEILKVKGKKARKLGEWVLALLRQVGLRTVTVSGLLPYGVGLRLQKAGIRLQIATQPLLPERAVKTPDELRNIRQSQQAAVLAMRAAVRMIRESVIDSAGYLRHGIKRLTSEDVQELITKVLLQNRCLCRETIVAGGIQATDPHGRGEGPLKGHEAIVIDIFPQHLEHGYCGDLTRTVVKGRPPKVMNLMYKAVLNAQEAALARVRPGTRCSAVHKTAANTFERLGYQTGNADGRAFGFTHSTGHGVGLAIHEAPSVSLNESRLKTGNVITVEPGLYYPDLGGIRIEDTVVVTSSGWRYLVPCEKVFEI